MQRIYAVGHSFGGHICTRLTAQRPEVKAVVLLFPGDITRFSLLRQEEPDSAKIICAILEESSDWVRGTTGSGLIEKELSLGRNACLEAMAPHFARKPVLVLGASRDQDTLPEQYCVPLEEALHVIDAPVQSIRLETDPFGSDQRDEIAEYVLDVLRRQVGCTL